MENTAMIKKILEFDIIYKYEEYQLLYKKETYKLLKIDSTLRIFKQLKETTENISFKELLEKDKIQLFKEEEIKKKLEILFNEKNGLFKIQNNTRETDTKVRLPDNNETSPTHLVKDSDDGCNEKSPISIIKGSDNGCDDSPINLSSIK